jgi:hypothetical protein
MKKLIILLTVLFSITKAYAQTDTLLVKEKLKKEIIKESKEKGKYDFFTPIKGHEYDGSQIKPGVFASNIEVALIKWGMVNSNLGVKSLQEAYAIFAEFKGREVTQKEKECIKIGFNHELDK